ncbi:hypothetical protein HG537_0E02470 [Torulaspora globosa]|uniref:1,3-beta-glucanosyltransferase n=1 Tax=Torulaspora globosa TaxID=48254 RepID=A0A7H9HWY1_9SACH|nr:hypothetical protein HG537_0E02470 [Torulaspora sp. CBS 2947]
MREIRRNLLCFLVLFLGCACVARGYVNPIEVEGKHFVDSVTKQPFYIKGVDYQPGGSSDVTTNKDPLSDSETCARDIVLFQELGINTIRIYSVNPDLDHDKCMSLLAAAGIYLILDVNSPLENQHLNRYEPWTTYNEIYLEHVFKVVEQFSHYNNTLGFFAGNEIINDRESAKHAPPYVKAVVRDMKDYIKAHSARSIPVGYSAADDLDYRVPLSSYLECCENVDEDISVDFYGVNSYQWCGSQTMESSGYDKLVEAYKNYTKPVFFSEFGCNKVLPRQFNEIEALYSKGMYAVFSGGLVYEFTQESNNYGLVELDSDGAVRLLKDFDMLKKHYDNTKLPTADDVNKAAAADSSVLSQKDALETVPICEKSYKNLGINGKVADGLAGDFVKNGVDVNKGHYVDLEENDFTTTYDIFDSNGNNWSGSKTIKQVNSIGATEPQAKPSGSADDKANSNEPSNNGNAKKNAGSAPVSPVGAIGISVLLMLLNFF